MWQHRANQMLSMGNLLPCVSYDSSDSQLTWCFPFTPGCWTEQMVDKHFLSARSSLKRTWYFAVDWQAHVHFKTGCYRQNRHFCHSVFVHLPKPHSSLDQWPLLECCSITAEIRLGTDLMVGLWQMQPRSNQQLFLRLGSHCCVHQSRETLYCDLLATFMQLWCFGTLANYNNTECDT